MTAEEMQRRLDKAKRQREQFIEMVQKEERHASRDPKGYRLRVYGLVALAYGYIFGVLLAALALLVGVIYSMVEVSHGNSFLIRPLIFLLLFVVAVFRSLWVRMKPPDGLVVRRGDFDRLYREVDGIADRLKAPRPDEIRIDVRANAAASQVPRLGLFGFYRNTLLLGLPLMLSLSPDEMRSVIAHEFGHFSGAHGKFGAWAYRVDATWEQLAAQFAGGAARGAWLFAWFVHWFQPRFSATTFVLRRANEYEADRAAAEVAGAANAARALMRLSYIAPALQSGFWAGLNEQAKDVPAPPANLLVGMPDAVRQLPPPSEMRRHLEGRLTAKTSYDDTHPSLSERLEALSNKPASLDDGVAVLSEPIGENAAQAFFGTTLARLIDRLSEKFSETTRVQWQKRHAEYAKYREGFERLSKASETSPLTESESVDIAYFRYKLEGANVAEPIFSKLVDSYPDNATARLWLGQILVERDDPAAEEHLRKAMERNPKFTQSALNGLAKLHQSLGEHEKLLDLREEAHHRMTERNLVQSVARSVELGDHFVHHDLSAERLGALLKGLATVPELDAGYLVTRVLPNGEQRPTLIVFHRKKAIEKGDEPAKLVQRVLKVADLPSGIVLSPRERKPWTKRLDEVPGSLIYRAGK